MLIEFSAQNFRSLKDRVTLSLIAKTTRTRGKDANRDSADQDNLIPVNSRLSLLRGAAIYGANASGKSNIIRAFDTMRTMIMRSGAFQEEDKLPTEPFVLAPHTLTEPSTFEAVLSIGETQYRYGFTADREAIHAEWLFALASSRESILFSRDRAEDKNDGRYGITVNRQKFKEGIGTEKQTGRNQLFLSKVATNQGFVAKKVRDFLGRQCRTLNAAQDNATYTKQCLKYNKEDYRDKIIEFVRRLDVDVVGLRVEEEEIPEDMLKVMNDMEMLDKVNNGRRLNILTEHLMRDANGTPIATWEADMSHSVSEGTCKIIALAGPIVDTLANGWTLFVDELDARLHPKITLAILNLFLSAETNTRNAQIVFATHDTSLLSGTLLRRDQIWFCEKESGATRLYSLADFVLPESKGGSSRVRKDASHGRDYITGRYGAVPYLGDLSGLFQAESNELVAGKSNGNATEIPR